MSSTKERKAQYFEKMISLLETYNKILICGVDHVGSSHMQKIRRDLRGESVILMGKNTLMRRCLRNQLEKNPHYEALLHKLRGNVGLVFTKGDLSDVVQKLKDNRVGAPAKAGIVAPNHVHIPSGVTTLEPTQTAFLQALNIPTRITKGSIEILNDIHLIVKGTRVGSSEAALLHKLGIRPFSYGFEVESVYDEGLVYDQSVLETSTQDLLTVFGTAVRNVASLSLAISFPTLAAVPHAIAEAYKNLLAIAVTTEYSFKQAEKVKEYLSLDPEQRAKLAAAAAPAASAAPAAAAAAAAAPAAAKAPEPEPAEEEGFDMGDLF